MESLWENNSVFFLLIFEFLKRIWVAASSSCFEFFVNLAVASCYLNINFIYTVIGYRHLFEEILHARTKMFRVKKMSIRRNFSI